MMIVLIMVVLRTAIGIMFMMRSRALIISSRTTAITSNSNTSNNPPTCIAQSTAPGSGVKALRLWGFRNPGQLGVVGKAQSTESRRISSVGDSTPEGQSLCAVSAPMDWWLDPIGGRLEVPAQLGSAAELRIRFRALRQKGKRIEKSCQAAHIFSPRPLSVARCPELQIWSLVV